MVWESGGTLGGFRGKVLHYGRLGGNMGAGRHCGSLGNLQVAEGPGEGSLCPGSGPQPSG